MTVKAGMRVAYQVIVEREVSRSPPQLMQPEFRPTRFWRRTARSAAARESGAATVTGGALAATARAAARSALNEAAAWVPLPRQDMASCADWSESGTTVPPVPRLARSKPRRA